ncbi:MULTISPECIES: GtrA family protein [Carnobacterium]|uniref:GtrA family protein n=1 Tax=Carnobacterium TaxID=2747 RepID=UPI0007F44467|nr:MULTISPECIES: GtrA family protein [Carnobacterium]MCO6017191.1 GtrA family protein [Carnobacterium divergens]MDT1939393.1 GtrA family protein [Carnobacterium divergens]MDT1941831.1 GtrA family protein [Carnobacterium divergens]MDT1947629.1 GtrA family protein [Carnobacterium divergens]MDT1950116.1 GtrA family protein [Carnobacterium divergens]
MIRLRAKIRSLREEYHEFLRYFFWGLIGTGLNIGLYELFIRILPIHYLVINFIVWFITVLFGYYTNRKFVFKRLAKSLPETLIEAGHFVGFRVVSGIADTGTMWLLFSLLGFNEVVAKLIANIIASLINYFTSKLVVFKRPNRSMEDIKISLNK